MRLLLDTFPFVWLTSEPVRLTQEITEILSDDSTDLFFSDASVLELCLKYGDGSLEMPQSPRRWVEKQRKLWRLNMIGLGRESCYRLSELPHHHDDAIDRILVATALAEDLTILTPDENIQKYPVTTIW
jgi:PIN domain nuclease of toxin-antitoxin system